MGALYYQKLCPVCLLAVPNFSDKYCSKSCEDFAKKRQENEKKREKGYKPNKDIVDIAVKAREEGLSYGQYVALHGIK